MNDEVWFSKYFSKYPWMLTDSNKHDYKSKFNFWFRYFVERCINIFKWSRLPFAQRHLEILLIGVGYAGLTYLDDSANAYDAVATSLTGVTNYPTEFTTGIGTTPIANTMFHIYGSPPSIEGIEREGIIVANNSTMTPLFPLISYYADILAHLDLSVVKVAIKMRADALIKGSDSKNVDAITEWYKNVENGKSMGVLDTDTFMDLGEGIIIKPLGNTAKSELDSLLNARTKYINEFFSDIGVNTAEEKRERLITDEVTVGFNRVLFNISDMLDARKRACEQIQDLYGISADVEINPCLKDIVSTQIQQRSEKDVESEK